MGNSARKQKGTASPLNSFGEMRIVPGSRREFPKGIGCKRSNGFSAEFQAASDPRRIFRARSARKYSRIGFLHGTDALIERSRIFGNSSGSRDSPCQRASSRFGAAASISLRLDTNGRQRSQPSRLRLGALEIVVEDNTAHERKVCLPVIAF